MVVVAYVSLTSGHADGQGTMKYMNGAGYTGQWKDGLRSGNVRTRTTTAHGVKLS